MLSLFRTARASLGSTSSITGHSSSEACPITFPDRRYGSEAHPVQHRISHNSNNLEQASQVSELCLRFQQPRNHLIAEDPMAGVVGGFVTCASAGGIHPPICYISDRRLATPQWSVILPFSTRMGVTTVRDLHASSSFAFESKPGDQCVSENSQVQPVHIWEDIRTENGLAFSIASSHVDDRSAALALHHATILIFKGRTPNRPGTFEHGGIADALRVLGGIPQRRVW